MPRFELRAPDGQTYRLDTHDLELVPTWLIDMLPDTAFEISKPAELVVIAWRGDDGKPDWPHSHKTRTLDRQGKIQLLGDLREALGLPAYDPPVSAGG